VTSAVLDSPACMHAGSEAPARPGGGRVTLEERLQAAWRGLRADGTVPCPVCRGRMTAVPAGGAGAGSGGGGCADCGALLT
jgi:hypothetical protein